MAGMSVGGLVSGLDTNSIVAQLTALEQAKVKREVAKKENAEKTLEKFKDLQTRLGNLANKATALELPDKFNAFKSLSNYEDYAVVSGKEGAIAGQYELIVNQLATTQKVSSGVIDSINTSLNKPTTLTLSTSEAAQKSNPLKKTVDVDISAGDTLKDIVNKINAAEGTGVKASIMSMANGENRLILTAVDTGSKGFTISESGGTGLLGQGGLGILDYDNQSSRSGGALLALHGGVATEDTKFTDLNTTLNTNNIKNGDVVGIYLPTQAGAAGSGAGWVTFNLFESGQSKTVGQVLEEINDSLKTAGANVTASINSSGEIVLSGDLANDPNLNNLNGFKIQIGTLNNGASLSDPDIFSAVKKDLGSFSSCDAFANVLNAGQNAVYSIDGIMVTSQSNSDDKTITGTVFTLKKVSAPGMEPIKLSLEPDMDSIANKISEFIEEFNSLMKFIDENTKSSIKEEEDKITGKKTSTRQVGVFTGDSNISALRDNLKRMLTSTIEQISGAGDGKASGYSTIYSSAARIGITTDKDGSMKVDKEKLTKALNADFEGVRKLFTANGFSSDPGLKVGNFTKNSTTGIYNIERIGGTNEFLVNGLDSTAGGFKSFGNLLTLGNGISFEISDSFTKGNATFVRGIASMITTFVEQAKSSVDGYFKKSEKTYQDRIDSIQERIDQLQMRVDNYTARITSQFASLERSMGNLQSQTANMMSTLSGLSR